MRRRKRKRNLDTGGGESGNSMHSTTMWGTLTRKSKAKISDDELCLEFMRSLGERSEQTCGHKKCGCMNILKTKSVCRICKVFGLV